VIGIKSSDGMALPTVGILGDSTGGTVNMNHPLELLTEIVRISQRPVVASNVLLKRYCPPGYAWDILQKPIQVTEDEIGNATIDTDVTFEFGWTGNNPIEPTKKSKRRVPFQVQIKYTRPDRYKCLRVINQLRPVSVVREEAIKHADVAVLGLNYVQNCGQMALLCKDAEGFKQVRKKLFFGQKFLEKSTSNNTTSSKEEYANFLKFARPLDAHLLSGTAITTKNNKKADEEDAAAKLYNQMKVISKNEFLSGARKTEVVTRRAQCNDQLSEMYYQYRF